MNKLEIKTEGDTHVIVRRRFAAPPELSTAPTQIRQSFRNGYWVPMVGRCPSASAKRGRAARSVTSGRNGKGAGFYLTGEYLELEPYSRIVHVNGCSCRMLRPTITRRQDSIRTAPVR